MNVRLQYNVALTAGVYYDGSMRMNNYNIRLWMITNTTDGESHNIAFERLKYFIIGCLESSVLINQNNAEACQRLTDAGIRITTLPEEPIDQIIGIMLYSKLNAIMEGRMDIVEVEVGSVMGDGMIYLHAEQENLGPFEEPGWWNSPDLLHYDSKLLADDKIMNLNRNALWRELNLAWPEDTVTDTSDTGNTIIFTDFNRNDSK